MQFFSRSIDSKKVLATILGQYKHGVYRKKGNMLMQGGAAQLKLVYKPVRKFVDISSINQFVKLEL